MSLTYLNIILPGHVYIKNTQCMGSREGLLQTAGEQLVEKLLMSTEQSRNSFESRTSYRVFQGGLKASKTHEKLFTWHSEKLAQFLLAIEEPYPALCTSFNSGENKGTNMVEQHTCVSLHILRMLQASCASSSP